MKNNKYKIILCINQSIDSNRKDNVDFDYTVEEINGSKISGNKKSFLDFLNDIFRGIYEDIISNETQDLSSYSVAVEIDKTNSLFKDICFWNKKLKKEERRQILIDSNLIKNSDSYFSFLNSLEDNLNSFLRSPVFYELLKRYKNNIGIISSAIKKL